MRKIREKRIISLLTALALSAGILSGCNNAEPQTGVPETETSAAVSAETASVPEGTAAPETEGTSAGTTAPAEPAEPLSTEPLIGHVITSVTADSTEGSCIAPDTTFTLTTSEDADAAELAKAISIKPAVGFELEKVSVCTYKLKTKDTLPENSKAVVTASDGSGITAYKWAFQTRTRFRVKQTYPADGYEYASPDTGIELTFTSAVDAGKADGYVSIKPEVKGRFEAHRNTLYFIPSKDLDPGGYTVTVKKGFASADGIASEEDFSYGFRVEKRRGDVYCYAIGMSETFIKGDMPVIEIYASSALKDESCQYDVKLYQYKNADSYYDALKAFADSGEYEDEYEFPVSGLSSVYSGSTTLLSGESSWGPSFLLLPDDISEGYYLADIKTVCGGRDYRIQRHIQINPLSVYSSELEGKAQFFINDTVSGKAADGARIELYKPGSGTVTAAADSSGIAALDINSDSWGRGVLKITHGGRVYCDVYSYSKSDTSAPRDLYYSYIYTDRECYLTSDTVKIWGVVRPRKQGVQAPDDLRVRVGGWWEGDEETTFPVKLGENGTFTAEYTYKDHTETWGMISLISGNDTLVSKNLNIRDYEKPTYVYGIDLPVYAESPQTVPVKSSITAAFYDGTPADGLTFEMMEYSMKATPSTLVTDEKGYAETSLLYEDNGNSWRPSREYVSYKLAGVEDVYTYGSGSFWGFFRDVMLESDYDRDKKELNITTSMIDPTNCDKAEPDAYRIPVDLIRGAPADVTVKGELHRHWYEKKETGSYYDFLQKKTVKRYDYTDHDDIVGTYTVNTKDGKAVFGNLPVGQKGSTYSMKMTYKDTKGRNVECTAYLLGYAYSYHSSENAKKNYTLAVDSGKSNEDRYYWDYYSRMSFKEGQEFTFDLMCNNEETEISSGGRILLQLHGNEFITAEVFDKANFTYKLTAEHIPNVNLCGAYFDGRHIYPIRETAGFCFDPSEREIIVEAKADKDKYSPGEDVKVTVTAKDKSGKALSGAVVSLSTVDEAAFAVQDQRADPLSKIYEPIEFPWVTQYYSYVEHSLENADMGEMGGGGDDYYIRKDFKDTAAFAEKLTGADGTAVFEFKLPDNITEWRVTAQAVWEQSRDRLYAGALKTPLICTQPLFITPVSSDVYLDGDDIAFSAKVSGEKSGSETITAKISGAADKTLTADSGGQFNFGKLPAGDYKVLFTAESGGNKDAVELPFTVTDTLLETDITKDFDLSGGISISPTKWPVRLTFYDKEYMLYTDALYKLCCGCYSRADMRVASRFARKELGFITEEEYAGTFEDIAGSDGLVKVLDAAQGDPTLTARICAAAPGLMNNGRVINAMNKIVDNEDSDEEDVCAAYLALAALDEPVINDIKRLLDSTVPAAPSGDKYEGPISLSNVLKLCEALAAAGDYDGAADYYKRIVTDSMKAADGDKLYIKGGNIQEATKYALATAARLHLPEADMMARYLIDAKPDYDTFVTELMVYLQNYAPAVQGDAVFTYNKDGSTETVKLDRHFGTCLTLTGEQFKNADFKVTSGGVYVVACYTGRVSENDKEPKINVTKTLTAEHGVMKPGEKVTVKITGRKYSVVDDVIPSCGRYDGSGNYKSRTVRLYTDKDGKASYDFRIATSGEYVVEGAVVRDSEGNWGQSAGSIITVK